MENYFKMNLNKQEINAISNLGLAHMGDCVFEILCRAWLCAQGETVLTDENDHLLRGYEALEAKLCQLGGTVVRTS